MNLLAPREEIEEVATGVGPDELSRGIGFEAPAEPNSTLTLERMMWFRDLSIRGKVKTIIGAFFAVCFVLAGILVLSLAEGRARHNYGVEVNEAIGEAHRLRSIGGDMRYNTTAYLASNDPAILARQEDAFETADASIVLLERATATTLPEFATQSAELRSDFEVYSATLDRLVIVRARTDSGEQLDRVTRALAARVENIQISAQELAVDLERWGTDSRKRSQDYLRDMLLIALALSLIAFTILATGLRYLSNDLSRKVVNVADAMTELARGNRDYAIDGADRRDEIGQMVRALALFKRANEKLELWARERADIAQREVRLEQERAAERDEVELHKAAMLEELALEFEETVGEVLGSVTSAAGELGRTARKMASTADEARSRADQLAGHMEEASSGAASAAAASDEFAVSIGEISRQAAASSQMAQTASDATEEADNTTCELANSAEQVGNIVQLISTIAQRTNLLALNASIEAARGGGTGRGFAVVASEVKDLAMQTSRATAQIEGQVRAMQSSTSNSVEALRAIADQVKQLEATSVSIASAVGEQSVAGQDLARSIDRAARGTEQVADHIEEVREMSLSTGVAANQVLASASDLETQAATLNLQVKNFLGRVRTG